MLALQKAEERRHARFSSGEAICMQFTGDDDLVSGCLVDLSVGGAYVRWPGEVAVGQELDCAFFVVTRGVPRLVNCRGRVAWVSRSGYPRWRGPGFGMCFTLYHHDALDLLRSFVHDMSA